MRFPAARRLKTASEFSRVKEAGQSHAGKFVVVNVWRNPDGGPWRSGIITSRKVGGAVQRNLVRRRLREIIRETAVTDGVWIVTIARWRAPGAKFSDLKKDWLRVAQRCGVLQQLRAGESS